jgi:hypothetical protein
MLVITRVGWSSELAESLSMGVDHSRSVAHLEVSKSSPALTTISLTSPEVTVEDKLVDFKTYQVFGIAGEPAIPQEGSPMVPQVTRFYRIPNMGGVDLVITDAQYDVVDNIDALPYQDQVNDFSRVSKDELLYAKDEWYPANAAEISQPMIMRDFRVVSVRLNPVQINPVRHQARIYRSLSANVVANNEPGVNEITQPRRPSGAWEGIYRSSIANLDDNALDNMTTTPGSLLIITKSDTVAKRWADSLAEWKTRKGYKVTVDARATWTATQMSTAIRNDYTNFDPPLEYVVLIGDPIWSHGVPIDGTPSNTCNFDHTFALGNTGDDLEDVAVGRLSGSSASMFATMNAKMMTYERNPHMATTAGAVDTTWYHKAFFYACVGNNCLTNYMVMRWGEEQFMHYTGVYLDTVGTHDATVGDQTLVRNRVAGGLAYFFYRGVLIGGLDNNIASSGTAPAGRFPVTCTVTCMSGDYATSSGGSDSPAEDFLTAGTPANPKGGVSGVGLSEPYTVSGVNSTLVAGMMYNIANVGVEHLGLSIIGAKNIVYATFGEMPDHHAYNGFSYSHNFSRFFNLLGDPSLSLWKDVPKALVVTHVATLDVGARQVELTALQADSSALEGATVCLWKRSPDSTWVVGTTGADGHVILPVNVNASGDMMVTVTKSGYIPYLNSISFSDADVMPMLCAYALDDDNLGGTSGNGDGVMNPGETIDLAVYVKNFGTSTNATNIAATLTSNSSRITVVNATSSFADLIPGDSVMGATPFRIQVAANMQNWERAPLTLTITSNATQEVGRIELSCVAQKVTYVRHVFTPSFAPGVTADLRVVVRNEGTIGMTGVTGRLTSFSPFVSVDNATATFGDVPAGSIDSNSTNFSLSANSLTFRGHQAPMLLVLTSDAGLVDSVVFNTMVGTADSTSPTGPDAFGYYAYENCDTSYEMHPTYNYVDISAAGAGTNLNLSDPGDQSGLTNTRYTTKRAIGFGFKFYGQVYDSLLISSNGWICMGTKDSLGFFYNYRIPGMMAPSALIAPYWDELATTGTGKGVWMKQDTTNHRLIVQWKANAYNGTCESAGTYSHSLDFEVILYDTTFTPTMDGNGQIDFQYNVVGMAYENAFCDQPWGCTIGIQAPRSLVGLEYAYDSTYSPGAARMHTGRAVRFTTAARMLFGAIEGHVTDLGTGQPIANAAISVDGYSYHTTSDAQGYYHIPNVLIGTYNLRAIYHRYNPDSVASILVELDSTRIVDFQMIHPVMALSRTSIQDTCWRAPAHTTFEIQNTGNGPMDYNIDVLYAGELSASPWDSVGSIDASTLCQDFDLRGCEFAYDRWWVTGTNSASGHHVLHKFDLQGEFAGDVELASTSANDWFDMAFDGTLIWGSVGHNIVGVDTLGVVQKQIFSPYAPTRGLAYDPQTHHFFLADYITAIKEIDTLGNVVQTITNPSLNIAGLAWNPLDSNGYKLYVFSLDGATSQTRVTRIHPVSHLSQTSADLRGGPDDRAAGCTITPGWNSVLLVFGGIIRNDAGARLQMYEMAFNTTWIDVAPPLSTVQGGASREVTLTFDPTMLRASDYRVDLHIHSTMYDSTLILPVRLTKIDTIDAVHQETDKLPDRYALRQNYPNPFNPTTQIRYDLKQSGRTQLIVYNVMGEKVAELVNSTQPAGSYIVNFDASSLSSGVYFYRLDSGNFSHVQKMVLMK